MYDVELFAPLIVIGVLLPPADSAAGGGKKKKLPVRPLVMFRHVPVKFRLAEATSQDRRPDKFRCEVATRPGINGRGLAGRWARCDGLKGSGDCMCKYHRHIANITGVVSWLDYQVRGY